MKTTDAKTASKKRCSFTNEQGENITRDDEKPLLLDAGRRITNATGRGTTMNYCCCTALRESTAAGRGTARNNCCWTGRQETTAVEQAARNHCCWTGRRENTESGRSRAWNHCCWTQDVEKPLLLVRSSVKPLLLDAGR